MNEKKTIVPEALSAMNRLPALIINQLSKEKKIRVLDYAGSTGLTYFQMRKGLMNLQNVEWTVFDNDVVLEIGKSFKKKEDNMVFLDALPAEGEKFDIVHVNTALQYFEDPLREFENISKYSPRYVILARLNAGDHPTFISAQHNESFPHPIPTIWLSVKEVVEKFESLGYAVLYKGLSERYADNVFSEDIREKYRPIGNIDLIFEKVDAN